MANYDATTELGSGPVVVTLGQLFDWRYELSETMAALNYPNWETPSADDDRTVVEARIYRDTLDSQIDAALGLTDELEE